MRRFQAAQGSLTYDPKGSQQKNQRMSLDDLVVSSQNMIDRAIRRFRRGERPARTQRAPRQRLSGTAVRAGFQTFITRPETVILPAHITHPVQLDQHFMAYQEAG